jgi:flagellar basal body rod protein FlgF
LLVGNTVVALSKNNKSLQNASIEKNQLTTASGQGFRARLSGMVAGQGCQQYAKSMVKLDNNTVF